jgi:hypothetical protein
LHIIDYCLKYLFKLQFIYNALKILYKKLLMKHLFIVGIIIFFGIHELNAQSDFRNSYIINNNNDTIYGLIDYRGNNSDFIKCVYRENINSNIQKFSPDEIKGYKFIDSKYFVSKTIKIDDEEILRFLEFLINGIVDVYFYRDLNGAHYFVDDGTDNLLELKNEKKEVIIDNNLYIKESKEYINLLKLIFKKSSEISNEVQNVSLNHQSLIKITHDYHNTVCSDKECIIYEKNLPKKKKNYGLIVGFNAISISEISSLPDVHYYMRKSQFGITFFPSIGLYYKVNMPYINERLYFQYEGTYSRLTLKTSNSYIEIINQDRYLNDITLIQNTLSNHCLVKYESPKGKIRPTIQFGGFINYFFKSDFNRKLKIEYPLGDTKFTSQSDINPFFHFDFGLNLGFGAKSLILNNREVFFDLKYQRGFGFFEGFNTNTFIFNLGFQIGK